MTRCACDRADLDRGDQCWQCSLDDDLARYERSVVSIADMRRRVDSQYITADNVEPADPFVEVDSEAESGSAVMVSYVWAFNGRLTQEYDRIAA